MAKGDVSN